MYANNYKCDSIFYYEYQLLCPVLTGVAHHTMVCHLSALQGWVAAIRQPGQTLAGRPVVDIASGRYLFSPQWWSSVRMFPGSQQHGEEKTAYPQRILIKKRCQ